MSGLRATRLARPGSRYSRAGFNSSQIISKYPAYGKLLAERQRFNNSPSLVIIEVGGESWERTKQWQRHPDFAGLVLTAEYEPSALMWPVDGCPCLIEWDKAAGEPLIIELVRCLLGSGAAFVTVIPLFVDYDSPAEYFDRDDQKWHRARESIRTYYPRTEVRHATR